jgi:hypothetical protein
MPENPHMQPLVPALLLYRFSAECLPATDVSLGELYRIPVFSSLDGRNPFADFRIGWSEKGLFVYVEVLGKSRLPFCRQTAILESEGVQLWIDTRDTHNIHRASRFCHWFVILPAGGGVKGTEPLATMLKINRARDFPKTFGQARLQVKSQVSASGYSLSVFIPGSALDGWDTAEHRRMGFNYLVQDKELGSQPLAITSEFPISEDPSLWQTLELVDR